VGGSPARPEPARQVSSFSLPATLRCAAHHEHGGPRPRRAAHRKVAGAPDRQCVILDRVEYSLAVSPVTTRLMRRQTSEWAVLFRPVNLYHPGVPRGLATLKATEVVSTLGPGTASPGGVADHGTLTHGRPSNLGDPCSSLGQVRATAHPNPAGPTHRRFVEAPAVGSQKSPRQR